MELARVQSEINRLFDNLLEMRTAGPEAVAGKWTPNADVLETRDQMIIRFELPGIEGGSIRLAVAGGNLVVSGRKPAPAADSKARLHSSERGQGEFRRLIHLGVSINPNKATAELRDGLLSVVLPKVANRRGEEVSIAVREESGAHGD
jgi:HSP20 family protein